MEMMRISSDLPDASRIGLGTWAIGGWLWGGADDQKSIATIHRALELGINLIDTAPVYGFGRSESIVGQAIEQWGRRDRILIATKAGLEWQADERVFRNCLRQRIMSEIDASLSRLKTDYIDIYQVHWPDPLVAIEETASVMETLHTQGKIRAVGVSNYSTEQMEVFQRICPLHTTQPPYNLFERGVETEVLAHSDRLDVTILAYGALCRGLLSGRMRRDTTFASEDLRSFDPKFQTPRYYQYLDAVDRLDKFAQERFGRRIIHLAVRWLLARGRIVALWGARDPEQLGQIEQVFGWGLSDTDMQDIDHIIAKSIKDPIGPEFMQSPTRQHPEYRGKYPVDA